MLVLIVILIALVAYFYTKRARQPFEQEPASAAQEILKTRFAGGEINEETYLNMLRVLKNK